MLKGKLAVVTGGSRGIGEFIAKEIAESGAEVIILYKNSSEKAQKVCDDIIEGGGSAHCFKCDVGDYSEVKEVTEEILKRFKNIDILVNNAGISHLGMLVDMEEEDWDNLINTNLKGVFNTCKHIGKHMMWNKAGSIINISSIWGEVGASCEVAYSASKGGINAFTKAFAKELALCGVRVNGISPGVIETEMNDWMNEDDRRELEAEIPLGRFGKSREIGKIAAFLASDNSSYMIGQIIRADGGII